jgi:hypothetical protein
MANNPKVTGAVGGHPKRLTLVQVRQCKSWIKVRNSKSSAYMRIIDGTF